MALWLSLPCLWWGLLPGLWRRSPQICFFTMILICGEGRWDWSTPTGIAPLGMFTLGSVLCATSHALCELSCDPGRHCSWPHLNHGYPMALMSLRCCFHQVTSIDPLKSGPRIAFIMELDPLWCSGAAQIPAWPRPLV